MLQTFDKQAAMDGLAALPLERSNGELATLWFAHWRGGALPQRMSLVPGKLRTLLPNVILFNVVPGESVSVRLAGTRCMHIFGLPSAGVADWIAAADENDRAARQERFDRIAHGALALETLRLPMDDGEDYGAQTLLLPFAPDADGVTAVMAHAHLRLDRYLKIAPLTPAAEPAQVEFVALEGVEDGIARTA